MEPSPNRPADPSPCAAPSPDDEDLPDLECAVCFSQFNNVFNTPKMLECRHTFCLECLARMNVKSAQPESLQCPLCRAYTPLPSLGLPKLATDATVLSCLPEAMQHVYSIRFNRSKGRLQVKRSPAALTTNHQGRSLDVGTPEDPRAEGAEPAADSFFGQLLKIRLCRVLILVTAILIVLSVAIVTVYYLIKK
ncbi:RING finger protein 223 [Trichomycterus rosablanca]|uniref:RING finger protein 223 n=1 Tax=Trichomycterus rosablanca TaxID=2290929 RepID=UPI002F35BD50